ncbi:MAG: twin-arginine translocase TatA/TatE family subunit [Desulfamplus sp.]
MFGLGMPEILLILAIALMVIGPKKLPDLAKSLGRALGEFKKAAQDFKSSIDLEGTVKEINDPIKNIKSDLKVFSDPLKSGLNSGSDKAAESNEQENTNKATAESTTPAASPITKESAVNLAKAKVEVLSDVKNSEPAESSDVQNKDGKDK